MSSKASRESTGFTESALFLGSNRDVCIRQPRQRGEGARVHPRSRLGEGREKLCSCIWAAPHPTPLPVRHTALRTRVNGPYGSRGEGAERVRGADDRYNSRLIT